MGLDVCWGHDTGVTQANVRDFQGDWTGTGAIGNPGVNDTERLELESGEYMVGPIVDTGAETVRVLLNSYQAGDAVTVEYRTAGTPNACAVAAWLPYVAPFVSNGYSQLRLTSTL